MDFIVNQRENHGMHRQLCKRGAELFTTASQADELFKSRLLEFFASTKKDDRKMKQIEILGETHRDADEAFHRHKRFCTACAEAPVSVLRYANAE